ncbi:MAG: hypothetical protein LBQ76_01020, partial [Candidatus Fibromonas sp.]|nr:hypothetical protein [Candidatus Fibromonas sp.]
NFAANSSVCYNNKPENCAKYGRLYDWNTAKKACPAGWHLPSDSEWGILANQVGSNAGEKLKSKGWGGTDAYGFTALPGGMNANGKHSGEGSMGLWWSATEHDAKNALRYIMDGSHGKMEKFHNEKTRMLSVRCVEESEEYRAKAAAKSKALEETIIKTIKAWQSKDEKTLNKLLLKDFGIAFLSRPGIYTVITMSDKISLDNQYTDFKTDYKIRYEKLPILSCKQDEKEDSGWRSEWSKPSGIYCDTTSAGGPLSGLAEVCCGDWSAKQIKKFEEIDSNSYQVIVVEGAFVFYLTYIENQWYLTVIDRYDIDCGGT